MIKKGLEKQFEDYVVEYREPIYRLAFSYVKNREDALDIVQDAIYKGFLSLSSLKDPNAIKTWFYRIVVNTALDFIKKRKREVTIGDEDILCSIESNYVDHYMDIDLDNALKALPDTYRTIIILRFFEDLKISEIAKILGINENTIKTRLYRGLDLLKIEMGDDERRYNFEG